MRKVFYLLTFMLAFMAISAMQANATVFDPLEVDYAVVNVDNSNCINASFETVQIIYQTPGLESVELIFPSPDIPAWFNSELTVVFNLSGTSDVNISEMNINEVYTELELRQNLSDPVQDTGIIPVTDQWINRMSLVRLSTGLY